MPLSVLKSCHNGRLHDCTQGHEVVEVVVGEAETVGTSHVLGIQGHGAEIASGAGQTFFRFSVPRYKPSRLPVLKGHHYRSDL